MSNRLSLKMKNKNKIKIKMNKSMHGYLYIKVYYVGTNLTLIWSIEWFSL